MTKIQKEKEDKIGLQEKFVWRCSKSFVRIKVKVGAVLKWISLLIFIIVVLQNACVSHENHRVHSGARGQSGKAIDIQFDGRDTFPELNREKSESVQDFSSQCPNPKITFLRKVTHTTSRSEEKIP